MGSNVRRVSTRILGVLLCATCLVILACEEPKAEKAEGAKAQPAAQKVDIPQNLEVLDSTLLHPAVTRERALSDVLGRLYPEDLDDAPTPQKRIEAACRQHVATCDALEPEAMYFAVMQSAYAKLGELARAAGDAASAELCAARLQAFAAWAQQAAEIPVPTAKEPLMSLFGDPTLVVGRDGYDVVVGTSVMRTLGPPIAEDVDELPEPIAAYLDAIAAGDLYTAVGIEPFSLKDGKRPNPGEGKLQVLLRSDATAGLLLPLLRHAYEKNMQAFELVVRSEELGTLSKMDLNVVKASILGSDQSVEIGPEQIIWRDTAKDETQAVAWTSLQRLEQILRGPTGQLVVYLEIHPSITGQQLANSLSALRARCGDQAYCSTLQLAVALKRRRP